MPWGNEEDVDRIVRKRVKEALARERAKASVPEQARRHNESAYEDLRTLDALVKTGDTTARRLYVFLSLITRLRQERPELWEEIKKFAKN